MISTTRNTLRGTAVAAGLVALLLLAGCATASAPGAGSTTAPEAGSTIAPDAAAPVRVVDAWVKAADSGMTGAFGVIVNDTAQDINVVSVESAASTVVELHETVMDSSGAMVMRPKQGGFVVPAGGQFEMAPGGNHIMLLDLVEPLAAGAELTFILTLADGSTIEFAAPVKEYAGANETYVPGSDSGMNMGN